MKKKQAGKTTRRRVQAPGMRELAQEHAVHALKKLVTLIDSKSERVALSAAQTVLDQAHGKVSQAMNLKGPEGGLTVRIVRFRQEGGHAE